MPRMAAPRLTDTSYAVMSLLDQCGTATPYQLKQIAQVSIFHFGHPAHADLHGCARRPRPDCSTRNGRSRAPATYVSPHARRAQGAEGLAGRPGDGHARAARPGFAEAVLRSRSDVTRADELQAHERRLAEYEGMHGWDGMPEGMRLALEGGIGHQRDTCPSGAARLRRPPSERPPSESAARSPAPIVAATSGTPGR